MNTAIFLQKVRKAFEFCQDTFFRRRRDAVYAHPMSGIRVRGDFINDVKPTTADIANCERLLCAYSRAVEDRALYGEAQHEDIWTSIAKRQRAFFKAIGSNDPAQLATYLCNMSRHDATHGTVQGEKSIDISKVVCDIGLILREWQKISLFRLPRR